MIKKDSKILLVGSGFMGIEYAKVLKDLGHKFIVVGKNKRSADLFTRETKIPVITGGIKRWLGKNKKLTIKAIVAVPENKLGNVALDLLENGVKSILVEKPGGYDFKQIKQIADSSKKNKAKVFVAYNRRFYCSVLKLQEFIKRDKGVTSFIFEFTEFSNKIEKLKKAKGVKEKWFFHNSTHVIDLAFFLCGTPKEISAYTSGSLSWHPIASAFVGAGISENGTPFCYYANWDAPGRWGIEVLTKKHRLILKPLEKLKVQKVGSNEIEEVVIDDIIDIKYKPGLYKQVKFF